MLITKKQLGAITYWQKGDQPTILICSGTHGDEWSVIDPLKEFVFANANNLQDFIFIPEVSPSAVSNKTRVNGDNLDLNRNFFEESTNEEVIANLSIINMFPFKKIFSFHEDTDYEEFYLYDNHTIDTEFWQEFIKEVKKTGLEVLNGIDDPDDPVLGVVIEDGYFSSAGFDHSKSSFGTLTEYLAKNKLDTRCYILEVPTKSTLKQKKALISLTLSSL